MFRSMFLAALLIGFSATAYAQFQGTMYGVLDDGLTYVNNKGGKSSVSIADGIARSNRLGFIGREDLGGGLHTLFKLEGSFSLNNGTLGSGLMFSHEAYVGLDRNSWGQVTLGRQYDFTDFMQRYTPCLYCGVYLVENADLDRIAGEALNNSVRFISRDINGFKVGAMYSFASNANGSTNFGRAYSLNVEYNQGPFSAMAVTTNINGAITHAGATGTATLLGIRNTSANLTVDNQRIIDLAASWAFGAFKADAMYTNTRLTLGAEAATDQTLRLGGDYTVRPNLICGGAAVVERLANSRWYDFEAGIKYLLSKRTSVYVAGLFQTASGSDTVASIATIGASSTSHQVVTRVGMTHTF
ncbi:MULTISPECIES: porin [Pandoraea]|uniref:porin n=1 Tax=Pandoraea TaxID=93217 RepID=UPI001F5C3A88|nr:MULTISPECIES: porin [Pandoraea]MCI3208632.1 hypothetical protein [Pandoraea sp. LA3]MDN4586661.1 hypothetical protein [Pandoraea capi]